MLLLFQKGLIFLFACVPMNNNGNLWTKHQHLQCLSVVTRLRSRLLTNFIKWKKSKFVFSLFYQNGPAIHYSFCTVPCRLCMQILSWMMDGDCGLHKFASEICCLFTALIGAVMSAFILSWQESIIGFKIWSMQRPFKYIKYIPSGQKQWRAQRCIETFFFRFSISPAILNHSNCH